MKKIVHFITVFLIAISLLAPTVYAQENSVTINSEYNQSTGRLSISGSIAEGEGKAIFIEITGPAGIIYMDQVLSKTGGVYEFEGPVITSNGSYKISIGRENGDSVTTATVDITKTSPGGGGPIIVPTPTPSTGDTIIKNTDNAIKDLDKKTTEQAVKDVVSLLADVAGLKDEDKAKVTEKITELVEKTVEKLVKLDEKAIEKTETADAISVQIKQEAINKVLESLESLAKGIKDSKLEGVTLKKLISVEFKDTVKEEVKVGIPVEVVKAMAEKGLDMSVQSGSVSFKLPANAINPEQLAGAEAGTTVQVTSKEVKAEDADKLTDSATKGATENEKMNSASKVYEFNLDMVKGDQITNMAKFAQKVTVEIPYTGTVNAEKLGVYYYNPETKVWDYVGGKVNKETGKVEFKTGHFSLYAVMEYNKTFEDIKDHWAQSDVELMASKHIIKGKGGDTFAPESNITRAEFATIIIKALGMDMVKYKGSFKDVEEVSWYSDIVQTAADNGIIQGYEGKFRPEDTITREEMTVIMMRAHKLVTGKKVAAEDISQFSDKGTISSWAIEAVAEAKGLGLINGVSASLFAPGDNATRAESAAIAKRLLDKLQ